MKQVIQSLRTGLTEVVDVPAPIAGRGQLLVRTSQTLISSGTERGMVDFGRAGLVGKARQQPERVRQVLDKARTDGVLPTLEAVFAKLDQPLLPGYCNVGVVIGVGAGVLGFAPGDRVASNGKHADVVVVPLNLAAKVPDTVSDSAAAFTVLGAIALEGLRLAQPTLGEAVTVIGLGLVGLLTVQLLRANGCRVLGVDFDAAKLELAKRFGAEVVDLSAGADAVGAGRAFSRGRGIDAVIITASTSSSDPVHQAAQMSRKRGRIVLVGVTGLELSRADFYEKELTFQVSCSYGPGRYDPEYEERGHDYPVGFVRWTEQRNFEAVLDMLADGRLDVEPLISHQFLLDQAPAAYDLIAGSAPSLGVLLSYSASPSPVRPTQTIELSAVTAAAGKPALGFIGAGNYVTAVLAPAFKASGARLVSVASSGGAHGTYVGRKFGFERTTTDVDSILDDPAINAVIIGTRHDSHADFVCRALRSGKHVFVEKPLALSHDQLSAIESEHAAATASGRAPVVMVGFNRRFAPQVVIIKRLLAAANGPKSLVFTANVGAIPRDHWTHDIEQGGGRLLGEACHFIDLLRFLVGAPITYHNVVIMPNATRDTATITLHFADGSIGTIHYFANGNRAFPKERLEVFSAGRILQLDNFRRLTGFGWSGFRRNSRWQQDKGQYACIQAFVRSIEHGGEAPMPFGELLEVSRVSVDVGAAARA